MKKVIIKTITALGIILASVLYSVICLIRFNTFLGYTSYGFFFPFGHIFFVVFYSFGIYINAAIFRLFFKRKREPVPLILAFAAFLSFIVSSTTVDYTLRVSGENVESRLGIWGIFLLIQIVVVNAASYLKNTENIGNFDVKIAFALLINFILVMGLSMLPVH
jgi:hypothetical protein